MSVSYYFTYQQIKGAFKTLVSSADSILIKRWQLFPTLYYKPIRLEELNSHLNQLDEVLKCASMSTYISFSVPKMLNDKCKQITNNNYGLLSLLQADLYFCDNSTHKNVISSTPLLFLYNFYSSVSRLYALHKSLLLQHQRLESEGSATFVFTLGSQQ